MGSTPRAGSSASPSTTCAWITRATTRPRSIAAPPPIARIFAETGIRDLFALLHTTIRKHGSQAQTVRLRNQWVTVDPRDWRARNDMTINVGLGTGSKAEQLAHLQLIIGAQKEAIAAGLVSAKNLF